MWNFRLIRASLLACSLVLLLAHTSPAQNTSDACATPSHEPARAHWLSNKALTSLNAARETDKKQIEAACQMLQDSLCLERNPVTLMNLATCRKKQDRVATAHALYLVAAALAKAQGNTRFEKSVRALADEIADYRSFLTIHVASPNPALVIELDDTTVGQSEFNQAMPIDPGEHMITVSAAGYKSVQLPVTIGQISDEQQVEVPALAVLEPPPLPAAPAQPAPLVETRPKPALPATMLPAAIQTSPTQTNAWPWVLGGVGAAALVVGGVSGVLAMHDMQTLHTNCDLQQPYDVCRDQALRAKGRGDFAATLALVSGSVGVVALATTAYWQFIHRDKRKDASSTHAAIRLDFTTNDHGSQLRLGGNF